MTTDSTPRKFTFDTVFDDRGRMTRPERPKRSFTPEEVVTIKAEAFAEGEASSIARAEHAAAAALEQIALAVHGAMTALAAVAHEHREGSAQLALAAAGKIADAALERFPEAPIKAAMVALAREIEAQPRLTVRVAADLVERAQAALEETAQAIGFPGQVVARAETLTPAAFSFDWGDGRAAFDPVEAADRVAKALEAALAAEGLHAEPLLPASEG